MKRTWCTGSLCVALLVAAPSFASLERARELAEQGDPEGALQLVERVLERDADDAAGLFLQGVLLVETRKAADAKSVFSRLIELRPDLPEPYNNLAVIQAAEGDYQDAVATLRKSLQTHASYRTAYDNLTKIYSQLASDAYGQALEAEASPRSDVVELVLLGTLGLPAPVGEPRAEGQIAATEPSAVGGPDAPGMDAPLAPEAPTATDGESVARAVEAWRAAWQAQDVDAYLGSYAAGFRPADGTSRDTWSDQRRERLGAPTFIRVTLAFLDEPRIEGDTAEIRFLQSYESNTFRDRVAKTLVLTWEDGDWKILEERAD